MDIATRIRKARERAGLTQKKLARLLKVGQSAVSHWESGLAKPDLANRVQLSIILRISFADLMPETNTLSMAVMKSPRAVQLLEQFRRLPPEQQEMLLMFASTLVERYGRDE